MLKHLPIIVRLSDNDVRNLDLMKALHIDRFDLDRQLARQPGLYAYWSSLYSMASAKVSRLKEDLEHLEARLYIRIVQEHRNEGGFRVTDVKQHVIVNPKYRRLQRRLRHWMDAERHLKFAEKAFDQRMHALQSINANTRREKIQS